MIGFKVEIGFEFMFWVYVLRFEFMFCCLGWV